jgi:protein-disulfide isomerase
LDGKVSYYGQYDKIVPTLFIGATVMIDQPHEEKPALTVVIQSWWTPALALLALVVGLLGGYFGRPLINKNDSTGGVAVVTQSAANPTATVDSTQQAITAQQVMTSLISQTKNFQGDPNATVTLIEFSDYQ